MESKMRVEGDGASIALEGGRCAGVLARQTNRELESIAFWADSVLERQAGGPDVELVFDWKRVVESRRSLN
jgi:hypothetical protein